MMAGDALVLLEAASAQADEAALDDLLAMLARRNFIASSHRLEGPLVEAIRSACAIAGAGCRLHLSHGFEEPTLRALVVCKPHAHLALSIVAERSGLFTAEAVGTVLDAGVEVHVEGRPILLDNVQRS